MIFNESHKNSYPLLLCNVWDVSSAKIAEGLGFKAIGTSSAAIASMLGYEDGEKIRFEELCYFVKKIANSTSLPLSVDLEAGYSRTPTEIIEHIKILSTYGVVGINLEDSIVNKDRKLVDSESFAKVIFEIKNQLEKTNLNLFLNVRIDTFLLDIPNKLEETLKRMELYTKAGANGLFIPCLSKESDIRILVDKSTLPINVMATPNLPNFEKLKELGIKRISMGNSLFTNLTAVLKHNLSEIMEKQSFEIIYNHVN